MKPVEPSKDQKKLQAPGARSQEITRNLNIEVGRLQKKMFDEITVARVEAAKVAGARAKKTKDQIIELRKQRDEAKKQNEKNTQTALKEIERTRLQCDRALDKEFEAAREEAERAQREDNTPVEKTCAEKEAQATSDFETASLNLSKAAEETLKPIRDEMKALHEKMTAEMVAGMSPIVTGTEVPEVLKKKIVDEMPNPGEA
jgi:hypothetical protein